MKKITFDRKIVIPIIYICLGVIMVVVTGIALARYNESIKLTGLVSSTGDMLATVSIQHDASYIENNVVYFDVYVKNTENEVVTGTDIDYSLTISNQSGSTGIFCLIDEEGYSTSDFGSCSKLTAGTGESTTNDDGTTKEAFKSSVTTKVYSFDNDSASTRRFRVFVKTPDGMGQDVKYEVKLNAEQKNME